MQQFHPRQPMTFLALAVFSSVTAVACSASTEKPAAPKTAYALPADAKTAVVTYDPGAAGFVRKGAAPNLIIHADGSVTEVSLFDGSRKDSQLTPEQLQDLLRFIIGDNDFINLTRDKIEAAVTAAAGNGPFMMLGDVGTTSISIHLKDQEHECSYRGAADYLRTYPKVQMLARYAAVEKRLADLSLSVAKGK